MPDVLEAHRPYAIIHIYSIIKITFNAIYCRLFSHNFYIRSSSAFCCVTEGSNLWP